MGDAKAVPQSVVAARAMKRASASDTPDAVVEDPSRQPAKKQKRETMPAAYKKAPGEKGVLHPHWRSTAFAHEEEDAKGRGKVVVVAEQAGVVSAVGLVAPIPVAVVLW